MKQHSALQLILDVAIVAARGAGKLIKENCGLAPVEKYKSSVIDLATKTDLECEDLVKDTILRHFPQHVILGEEMVLPGEHAYEEAIRNAASHNNQYLWVVDPIDGTTNFVHGIPASVVSIGVAYQGRVEVGVIYDPFRDELFTSIRGHGASMNGLEIRVDHGTDFQNGIFALSQSTEEDGVYYPVLSTVQRNSRGTRDFGSCALHLAWVACGRLTGFIQHGLKAWDMAAGSLLVVEAKGVTTSCIGDPYDLFRDQSICASSGGSIHHTLTQLFVKHRKARRTIAARL